MLPPDLAADLAAFQREFTKELSALLAELRADPDVYGFAVELPEDFSNLAMGATVGRETLLVGEQAGSAAWLDRRYSPVEWDYLTAAPWERTQDALAAIEAKAEGLLFDEEEYEDTPIGEEFREALYRTMLDVMLAADAAGEFGTVWYKMLFFSDNDDPIVAEAFRRLNSGRALREAAAIWDAG